MNNLVKQLEDIVSAGLNTYPLPYKKGKSIRVGSIAIRHSKTHGYILFDVLARKQVDVTFSKVAALAYAKNYKDYQTCSKILDLDAKLQKHFNDSLFFKNTIETSIDDTRKCVAEARLDMSEAYLIEAHHTLEDIIFESQ
jgi:hypothetical protein